MDTKEFSIGIWKSNSDASTELENKATELDLRITSEADLILLNSAKGWLLKSQNQALSGEILVDFVDGKNARRKKIPGTGKQPLAKAIGIKKSQRPTVLDATAGLGGDAYILASLGCKVWLCERNPIVSTLLNDAIDRAKIHPDTANTFRQTMLFVGSTLEQAKQVLDSPPDVIYLDPMYPKPTKKRSANVKKEMQIMRALLTPDIDASEWLTKARNWSKKVVVKRPVWAEPLAQDVNGYVESKNHRYDIFMGYRG